MAPKIAKWTRESERLEQSLRRMDKELRRLKGVEDFHQTKSREVRDQLTRIWTRLSSANEETALWRAALTAAKRELDTAISLEAQAKRNVDRVGGAVAGQVDRESESDSGFEMLAALRSGGKPPADAAAVVVY
jgi:chromosome segregation ATPase